VCSFVSNVDICNIELMLSIKHCNDPFASNTEKCWRTFSAETKVFYIVKQIQLNVCNVVYTGCHCSLFNRPINQC